MSGPMGAEEDMLFLFHWWNTYENVNPFLKVQKSLDISKARLI